MSTKATFYNIKSFTDLKKSYVVRHLSDGQWLCNCSRFVFQSWKRFQDCKHITKAKKEYEKNRNISVNN